MSSSKPPASVALIPAQSIHYALSNTYTCLPPSTAPLDYTQRHRKVHDWILYVDILPGSDPDLVDRVTFDMRDDSFRGMSFTCHCPIRIRDSGAAAGANVGAAGASLNINAANASSGQSIKLRSPGETTQEQKVPSTNPRPRHSSRYRFSTRQQTYGAVDVRITLRGVGGSKSIVDYRIVLQENAPEIRGVFVEKRPQSVLRPIKMTDGNFSIRLLLDVDMSETGKDLPLQNGAENRELLRQIAESIYSRSKRPMRAVLRNLMNGESWEEEWFGKTMRRSKIGAEDHDVFWTLSFLPVSHNDVNQMNQTATNTITPTTISIDSPNLAGGEGLNECYKIIEGLPSYLCECSTNQNTKEPSNTTPTSPPNQHSSLHVQIDVSNLTILQIIKVCQNYVKYEEAMDSFMPWYRREDCCSDCYSNKLAMKSEAFDQPLNNKERNNLIAKCTSFRDLISCLNPEEDKCYKLNLRNFNLLQTTTSSSSPTTSYAKNKPSIEFRQHPSSKDKTITTHWIRFCMAFVKNSARLRAPNALKNTTSIEDEFDLLFEYVVKDRALRNFYQRRRDGFAARDEEERLERLAMVNNTSAVAGNDDMSISDGGSDEEDGNIQMTSNLKREADVAVDSEKSKRLCF